MKALAVFFLLAMWSFNIKAGSPYRNYLLTTLTAHESAVVFHAAQSQAVLPSTAFIPRFERPKGAIFCRMEDAVTKSTKVWLKIGVQ